MSTEFSGSVGAQPNTPESWSHYDAIEEQSHWDEEYAYEESSSSRLQIDDRKLAQALGWFSIGLGLAELLAPQAVARTIGVGERHATLLRCLGARELMSGVGLLSEASTSAWAWSRVAGDAMDLALLGAALREPDSQPQRIAAAAAVVAGAAALDVYASQRLQHAELEAPEIRVTEVVSINATPETLYAFWSNLENLPLFMSNLQSVSKTSERISHWVARAPGGTTVEWDSEIVDDQKDVRIGWRTLPDSQVRHEGLVTFERAPAGRGAIVRVEMIYWPPAGRLAAGRAPPRRLPGHTRSDPAPGASPA